MHFFPYQFSSLESKVLFLSLYTPYPTPKGFCLLNAFHRFIQDANAHSGVYVVHLEFVFD